MPTNRITKQRPTQRKIASELGLSQTAVTVALSKNPDGKLATETVAKIREYAAQIGYRPNRIAQVMRNRRSHTIGLVGVFGSYHATQERFRLLTQGAIQAGYRTIFADVDWFEGRIMETQNYLLDMAVEGIIFCNIADEYGRANWQAFAQRHSLPLVSMSGMFEGVDQASSDFCSAYREMTLHHIGQGARQPALLLPFHDEYPEGTRPAAAVWDRFEGFVQAIRSAGGEVIEEPDTAGLFQLPSGFSSRNPAIRGRVHHPIRTELYQNAFDVGYHQANRLLDAGTADSFVCSNDDVATGAMSACIQRGIRVPEDMRISGCDNTIYAQYLPVSLTSIEQSPRDMVEWSVRRIIELIENPEKRTSPQKKNFPCKLIIRKSTDLKHAGEPTNKLPIS